MNYRILLAAGLMTLAAVAQADTLCQQKEQAIQREIDYAHQYNNQNRANGLERALSETRASCSDEKLKAAHLEKIKKHQQKVSEREQELKQQIAKGSDAKKIAKREKKLADARRELEEVQAAPY